jgi:hypothetical protein
MVNPLPASADHGHDRDDAIAHTRNQVGPDPSHVDRTDHEAAGHAIAASTLRFVGVSHLPDPAELTGHVANLIRQHANAGDEISASRQDTDTIVYEMGEKNLALSIARHVEGAFKGFTPVVEIQNPEENEFYRITVTFHPLAAESDGK